MLFGKKKKEKKETKKETETAPIVKPIVLPVSQTKFAHKVLIKPIITEKATTLETQDKYLFEVSPQANKIEIKKAIKELYNIEPQAINIIKVGGKNVRYGKTSGRTKNWKKAIISLKKGEKIEFTKK